MFDMTFDDKFWLDYFFWAQMVGFLAFIVSVLSYQFKSQKTMFALRVFDDALWTTHYFMLSAITPAISVMIAVLRTFFIVFVCPQYKVPILAAAVVSTLAVCIYFGGYAWQNYLPFFASLFYVSSVYFHEDYVKSRVLMGCGLCMWILIGVMFGSLAEIISSAIGISSLMVGFYRHKKLRLVPRIPMSLLRFKKK